jgi:hypothetical protein
MGYNPCMSAVSVVSSVGASLQIIFFFDIASDTMRRPSTAPILACMLREHVRFRSPFGHISKHEFVQVGNDVLKRLTD